MENKELQDVEQYTLRVPIEKHVIPPPMVWSVRDMLIWIEEVKVILGTPVNYSDMDEVSQRISILSSHLSSSVDVLASAKWFLATARGQSFEFAWNKVKAQDRETMQVLNGVASSTNVKAYITDRCADLIWLETSADRINSAIVHSVDALRSLLSKGKVDKQVNAYAENVRRREEMERSREQRNMEQYEQEAQAAYQGDQGRGSQRRYK